MTTIICTNELVRRAVAFVIEGHRDNPERSYEQLIEEASMRFNLGPLDSEALRHAICQPTIEEAH